MPIGFKQSSSQTGGGGISPSDQEKLNNLPMLNFRIETTSTIVVNKSADNPTRIDDQTDAQLFGSEAFQLITDSAGSLWVKNVGTRPVSMAGTITYQLANGSGGAASMNIWSELSPNDGQFFTENQKSLRTTAIANTSQSSVTQSAAIPIFLIGDSIRLSFFNSGAGTLSLQAPLLPVNFGSIVKGLSLSIQMFEV